MDNMKKNENTESGIARNSSSNDLLVDNLDDELTDEQLKTHDIWLKELMSTIPRDIEPVVILSKNYTEKFNY